METTFISIHDLSIDARLLYVSTSIEDILGYLPHEVVGRSCWDYFHPDEIPFAQVIHGRSIQLDKAAVLNYCRIKNRAGQWIGCECVFTVVHDCLVASTSIYSRGKKSQKRANDAPIIRQLFSSSPRDPRYHMLQYISSKFTQRTEPRPHEPRAALFLNRFSRTLTIMYATNGLSDLLGISNDQLTGKSFYYCIQENCLREAVKCLESAKANDSIAYLRFWYRDPRQDDPPIDTDEAMSDAPSSVDDDEGGVHLSELLENDDDGIDEPSATSYSSSMRSSVERDARHGFGQDPNSRSSSGDSTDNDVHARDAIFDKPEGDQQSRTSSVSTPDGMRTTPQTCDVGRTIELEAVVSCTSDGLVVVLRGARLLIPHAAAATDPLAKTSYTNGLFASPWATKPIMPEIYPKLNRATLTSQSLPDPLQADNGYGNGAPQQDFMNSIREVVAFAWSLTGINGSLAQYARGNPIGESQPLQLSVWNPRANTALANEAHPTYDVQGEHPQGFSTASSPYPPRHQSTIRTMQRSSAAETVNDTTPHGNSLSNNQTRDNRSDMWSSNHQRNYNPSTTYRCAPNERSIEPQHTVQAFANHQFNSDDAYKDLVPPQVLWQSPGQALDAPMMYGASHLRDVPPPRDHD